MTKFLVDADIVAFKAATAAEQPTNWGNGLWTLHGFEDDAMAYCLNYFADISEELGEGFISLYLTGENNWRKSILPSYKANRKDKRKPMLLPVQCYHCGRIRSRRLARHHCYIF